MVLCFLGSGLETGRNICPSAVVERLFLAPDKLGIGVLVEMGRNLDTASWLVNFLVIEASDAPSRMGRARSAPDGRSRRR